VRRHRSDAVNDKRPRLPISGASDEPPDKSADSCGNQQGVCQSPVPKDIAIRDSEAEANHIDVGRDRERSADQPHAPRRTRLPKERPECCAGGGMGEGGCHQESSE
jgi:hypothetical protein